MRQKWFSMVNKSIIIKPLSVASSRREEWSDLHGDLGGHLYRRPERPVLRQTPTVYHRSRGKLRELFFKPQAILKKTSVSGVAAGWLKKVRMGTFFFIFPKMDNIFLPPPPPPPQKKKFLKASRTCVQCTTITATHAPEMILYLPLEEASGD